MSTKNRIIAFLCLVMLPLVMFWLFQKKLVIVNGVTMGTIPYTVKCYVHQWVQKSQVQLSIEQKINDMINIFSTWETSSEITQLNRSDSVDFIDISNELYEVVYLSESLYKQSSGYFDPTIKPLVDLWGFNTHSVQNTVLQQDKLAEVLNYVGFDKIILEKNKLKKLHPSLELDLSSIAKGYIVDQIVSVLENFNSNYYMVEIGGELRVSSPKNKFWTIGIQNPKYEVHHAEALLGIDLSNKALATSGDYQNYFVADNVLYSHIFDPKLGMPVQNSISSVSVLAPTCVLADGVATMLMSMGISQGLSFVESRPDLEALYIVRDSQSGFDIYQSSGFSPYIKWSNL